MNDSDINRRRNEYRQLWPFIPGKKTSQKLKWLEDNLHCSRQTARTWNMAETPKPMPDSKLKLLRRMLPQ